jgi:hypothetical protein
MLQGSLNVTGRQIRIFRDNLIDCIACLFEVAYCARRYPCASNHRRIVAHIPRLLDPPDLIVRTMPQPFRVSFCIGDNFFERYSENILPANRVLQARASRLVEDHAPIQNVECRLSPKLILKMAQSLGDPAEVLERHVVLPTQQPQGAERYDILERIDPAISRIAAFLGIARREKSGPIPIPQLRWGETGQAFNVFLAERDNDFT